MYIKLIFLDGMKAMKNIWRLFWISVSILNGVGLSSLLIDIIWRGIWSSCWVGEFQGCRGEV